MTNNKGCISQWQFFRMDIGLAHIMTVGVVTYGWSLTQHQYLALTQEISLFSSKLLHYIVFLKRKCTCLKYVFVFITLVKI